MMPYNICTFKKKHQRIVSTIYPHVEKARVVNALYEYVRKSLTRVGDGIVIEKGKFKGSGGQKRDEDGDPIVRYKDVIDYFDNGGDPDLIIDTLGPNVLKINYRKVYDEVLKRQRKKATLNLQAKAKEWWYDDAYVWQKEARSVLMDWSEEEQDRKIMVIYDPDGNSGKTVFCKRFQDVYPDQAAYIKKSKCDNMSYLLKDYKDLKYVLVDYTRDDENWGSPKFLESLKDGIVQSNKYQSEHFRVPNVQVAVMTNHMLKWKTLTRDRWEVYEVKKGGLFGNKPYLHKWSKDKMDEQFSIEVVDPYGDRKRCKYTERE